MFLRLYVWGVTALPTTIRPSTICAPDDPLCKVTGHPSPPPMAGTGIDKTAWGIGLGVVALVGALGVHGFISASREAARLAAEAARKLKEDYDDLGNRH